MVEYIRTAERLRTESLLTGDIDAFASLCDERLVYTHSVGRRDDKTSLLQALRSGVLRYLSIDHELQAIHLLGNVAYVSGVMQAEIEAGGKSLQLNTLTTSVWVQADSRWQLIAFHTTARP